MIRGTQRLAKLSFDSSEITRIDINTLVKSTLVAQNYGLKWPSSSGFFPRGYYHTGNPALLLQKFTWRCSSQELWLCRKAGRTSSLYPCGDRKYPLRRSIGDGLDGFWCGSAWWYPDISSNRCRGKTSAPFFGIAHAKRNVRRIWTLRKLDSTDLPMAVRPLEFSERNPPCSSLRVLRCPRLWPPLVRTARLGVFHTLPSENRMGCTYPGHCDSSTNNVPGFLRFSAERNNVELSMQYAF